MRASIDDPLMAGFVEGMDRVHAVAEASPGFVWRLTDDSRDGVAARPFHDKRIIVTLSVWESVESLRAYVYRSDHTDFLRARREWFLPYDGPPHVMWWIDEQQQPTLDQGVGRLEHLAAHGASPFAFTFRDVFPPA